MQPRVLFPPIRSDQHQNEAAQTRWMNREWISMIKMTLRDLEIELDLLLSVISIITSSLEIRIAMGCEFVFIWRWMGVRV